MVESGDTIVAIATPPGRGGIGIVRLSGPDAKAIAGPLLRLRSGWEPGRARFAEVVEDSEDAVNVLEPTSQKRDVGHPISTTLPAVLDEAVVTWFRAPSSYTGEDVVEIAAHGSPVLLDTLLRACVRGGARLAEPGEFTQRAFLSGRLDLTQAEAVHGLIEATTLAQARRAAMQLGGGLSRRVAPVKRELIELIAGLEAGIDFAEDDLDLMADAEIGRRMEAILRPLAAMEESYAYGRVLREGFRLAIVGRPNAGKSSLFNRLIGRDRAIVTAQAGTTRDPVEERMEMGGIPVEIVDTAGLRSEAASGAALDEAEAMGVAKSRETMAEADVVLLVVAADAGLQAEDRDALDAAAGRRLIVAVNKVDLVAEVAVGVVKAAMERSVPRRLKPLFEDEVYGTAEAVPLSKADFVAVGTSAVDGTGIEEMRGAILAAVGGSAGGAAGEAADTVPLTNLRQHGAVAAAVAAVRSARQGLEAGTPHEMLLLDLHEGLTALDGLTGATHTEEILRVIFGRFCVGK